MSKRVAEPYKHGRGPRNYRPVGPRAMARSEWQGECLIYLAPLNKDGYGKITYRNRTEATHRAIWMEMHGPIPAGLQVCHTCDNPGCWLLAHLFLGTYQENVDDKVAKGRHRGWKWSKRNDGI